MKKIYFVLFTLLFLSSCNSTRFFGSSHIEEGRLGCEKKCEAWDMELAGMVAMGEYSSGCICQKRGEDLSINEVGQTIILSNAGVGAAVSGVMMQMQRDDATAASNSGRNN